jgi:hypothetical protein
MSAATVTAATAAAKAEHISGHTVSMCILIEYYVTDAGVPRAIIAGTLLDLLNVAPFERVLRQPLTLVSCRMRSSLLNRVCMISDSG